MACDLAEMKLKMRRLDECDIGTRGLAIVEAARNQRTNMDASM